MDLFQCMEIFVAVVEGGNFSRAAETLQITRPAVTNAVKALESSLGVRLLHRTTRRISFTAEGVDYYDRVSQILGDVAEAQAAASGRAGKIGTQGKLRVDLPVALACPLIIPALKGFSEHHPEVELIVGVSDNPADLVAEGIDCVVRIGDLADSSMVAKKIGSVAMVTCGSPAYFKAHGMPHTLDELQNHRAVGFFSGRSRRMMDWHFLLEGQESVVKLRAGILVNDSEAFIESGLAGFGLLQAVGVGVSRHLESGTLQEILPKLRSPSRTVSVLYPSKRHVAPQVRAFVEWVTKLFSSGENRWLLPP